MAITVEYRANSVEVRKNDSVPRKKDTLKNSCRNMSSNTTAAIAFRVVICARARLLQVSAGGPFAPASSMAATSSAVRGSAWG